MKINLIIIAVFLLLASCKNAVPRKPVVNKTGTLMEESVLYNKNLNEAEEAAFKELMAKDSLQHYISSPLGFWYTYNVKIENGKLPQEGDSVFYNYAVYDLNNQPIYSEEELGEQNYVVDKQDILEGLRNGLKLMKKGEVVTFLFPSHKVYGYAGDQQKIGINQPLIFKVKLNKIE